MKQIKSIHHVLCSFCLQKSRQDVLDRLQEAPASLHVLQPTQPGVFLTSLSLWCGFSSCLFQDLVRRNIEENKVLAASLRKLPHMHRRWFVLYSASDKFPAKLEYYLNEKQWREGYTPKTIILKDCFNICKKQDSRDSKNKHVIAIYTLNKCHSILFEEEQELRNWLVQLLSHQKGSSGDGRIPKPNFENMWQVNVKPFKSEDPLNTFVMSGAHRLCVTESDLKFFPIGTSVPISFPFISLRAFQCNDRIFQIETGRSAPSGPGTIYVHSDDKEISAKIMSAVSGGIINLVWGLLFSLSCHCRFMRQCRTAEKTTHSTCPRIFRILSSPKITSHPRQPRQTWSQLQFPLPRHYTGPGLSHGTIDDTARDYLIKY